MIGNLFEEDGIPAGPNPSPVRMNNGISNTQEHRGPTKLCGLENLGATCYLNSLIQALFLTPEFREGLMALDLDHPSDSPNPGRNITFQLQKLFVEMLLHDVASVSTSSLTESFGWTDNEELYQQQDVQELIRILFCIIQQSLENTPGQDLISRLYQGLSVSKVECQRCQSVSNREESYQDLTVAVGQNKTLKMSLYDAYCEPEAMTGSNQYLCSNCQTHSDANRVVKLRHLPPILSLSLLRFLYDPVKQQRFKDESRLEFPLELDMAPFCEDHQPSELTVYELLSVVVHRGGAHGGHYFALINDVDRLGQWDLGSTVSNINDHRDPNLRPPGVLLKEILQNSPDNTLSIENLLSEVFKYTGVQWSKSYKTVYGSIQDFLNSHCTYFFVDGKGLSATVTLICESPEPKVNGDVDPVRRQWFNFNDTEVTPVPEEEIQNYFEGEESAYMLIYRRKSLKRPEEAIGNKLYSVPYRFQELMQILNEHTEETREMGHKMWLRILPYSSYSCYNRQLFAGNSKTLEIDVTVDGRDSLTSFKNLAARLCAENLRDEYGTVNYTKLHRIKQVNDTTMIVEGIVPDSDSISLEEFKVSVGEAFLASDPDCDNLDFEACNTGDLDESNWDSSCVETLLVDNDANQFNITLKFNPSGIEESLDIRVTSIMTIRELRNTVQWEMTRQHEWDSGCMLVHRGEGFHSLEPPLHDHLTLSDAGIQPNSTLYFEESHYDPLQAYQVWLSFAVDDSNFNKNTHYVIMDQNSVVGDLVTNIIKTAQLDDDEAWHVGRTNVSGDIIKVLNNPSATLSSEKLVHGSHLVLKRGSALEKGLTRLKIVTSRNVVACPSKAPALAFLNHVDVDLETTTLAQLKQKLISLLATLKQQLYQQNQLRVRFLNKSVSRPGKILRQNSDTLKSMEVGKSTILIVECLTKEEQLRSSEKVLQVWRHEPGGCQYEGPKELIWDAQQCNFAEAVASFTGIEQENLVIARYHPRFHSWTLFSNQADHNMVTEDEEKSRALPFSLNDGDIIGIKDACLEKGDLETFTTTSDVERWLVQQDEAEKEQKRSEAAAAEALEWTAAQAAATRIPERGIQIHVRDFC